MILNIEVYNKTTFPIHQKHFNCFEISCFFCEIYYIFILLRAGNQLDLVPGLGRKFFALRARNHKNTDYFRGGHIFINQALIFCPPPDKKFLYPCLTPAVQVFEKAGLQNLQRIGLAASNISRIQEKAFAGTLKSHFQKWVVFICMYVCLSVII